MNNYIALPKQANDITNQKFGRLTALGPIGRHASRSIIWRCKCDCGRITDVTAYSLRCGNTQSCGCLKQEISITHGMSESHIYTIWRNMITRCANPNYTEYANYGGRGITVCNEWHDFQTFYDYVSQLSNYDGKGYTLDRVNNDGNYEPGNVKWSTSKQQNRNRRDNVMIAYDGKIKCVADWADETGINYVTLQARLRNGWTAERALTQPVRQVNSN